MHGKAETKQADAGAQGAGSHTTKASQTSGRAAEAHAEADLDFESLDLTIETVEERISPSETNVFDK